MVSLRDRLRDERGFGLIELMVTLAVLGIVMLGMFTAFFRTSDESSRMSRLIEFRQSARASVQLIERDVRMAGSGWGRSSVVVSSGTDSLWGALSAGPGTGPNDSLTVFGAWSNSSRLTVSMPFPSSTLRVRATDVASFPIGSLVVVTDPESQTWHMFCVTGIAGSDLQHATSSSYNNTTNLQVLWPLNGYPVGSAVYRVSRLTYRVDSTNFGRPCLVRQEIGGSPQVVAYDLNRFQVWYRMQDSTLTRNPTAWGVANGVNGKDFISQVQPRICVRVTGRNRPTLLDSVWAEVRPRTF